MISEEKKKLLEIYNKGMELYKERKFSEAKEKFKECLKLCPEDGPSELYYERCEFFIKNPPPENWDGVYTMTSK